MVQRIGLISILISSLLSGCCEPSEDLTNSFHQTLLSNAVMLFTDSAENEIALLYDRKERIDLPGYADSENHRPSCEARAHMYAAHFNSGPDQELGFKEYVHGTLIFNNGTFELVDEDYATDTFTIQGYTYNHCHIRYSDTTYTHPLFVFDLNHGVILLAKENEYRWERVLN